LSPAPAAPVVGVAREADVVAPSARDLDEARGEALLAEAEPAEQRDGRRVARLDPGLDPVQP
jgi:hypothetical protein